MVYERFSKYCYLVKRAPCRLNVSNRRAFFKKGRVVIGQRARWFRVAIRGIYHRLNFLTDQSFMRPSGRLLGYHKFGSFIRVTTPTFSLAPWVFSVADTFVQRLRRNSFASAELFVDQVRVPFTTFNFQFPSSLNPREGYLSFLRQNRVFRISRHVINVACTKGFGWFQTFSAVSELHFYFTRLAPILLPTTHTFRSGFHDFNFLFLDYQLNRNLQLGRALRGGSHARHGFKAMLRYERFFRRRAVAVNAAFSRYLRLQLVRSSGSVGRISSLPTMQVKGNSPFIFSLLYRRFLIQRL